MTEVIQTARLVLRAPEPSDAPRLAMAIGAFEVARWLTHVPHPYKLQDAQDFIARGGAGEMGRTLLIWRAEQLIGCIGLNKELGFWLVQDAWGQGYATEAGLALLNSYFSQPDAVTIGSSHFDENARSGRVLSKLGFSYLANGTHSVTPQSTGEKVACLGMVLTPEQWHASHPFEIKTPRLTLSYFRQSDVEELSRIGGDAQVAPMILSATAPWPKTAVAQWIEKSRFRGKLGFRMSVRLGGAVIGVVGVSPVNPETPPSVMYFVDPNHWGHGYATEAMQHFLSVLIARFDLDAVIADHFDDNPTSGRVLRKLGFQETCKATGKSAARLEPAPLTVYRLNAQDLKA